MATGIDIGPVQVDELTPLFQLSYCRITTLFPASCGNKMGATQRCGGQPRSGKLCGKNSRTRYSQVAQFFKICWALLPVRGINPISKSKEVEDLLAMKHAIAHHACLPRELARSAGGNARRRR